MNHLHGLIGHLHGMHCGGAGLIFGGFALLVCFLAALLWREQTCYRVTGTGEGGYLRQHLSTFH